jgi:hypothetical protein
MTPNKPRVGRPEVPYETKMMRVPLPCVQSVKKVINQFKERLK